MAKKFFITAAFFLVAAFVFSQGSARIGKPGFVGLSKVGGVWNFVSPEGKPFFSRGVDVVKEMDDSAKPGERGYYGLGPGRSLDAWAVETVGLLGSWNFDTIGCWSSDALRGRGMYTVDILYVRIEKGGKPVDVFDKLFEGEAQAVAQRVCAKRRDDKELLGYFLENEQPWYGDYGWYTGHVSTLLDSYMAMPENSAGKKALVSYFRGAYGDIGKLNGAYGYAFASWEAFSKAGAFPAPSSKRNADREAFVGVVARRYYAVLSKAIRVADPNHLILGDRFANYAPKEVIRACGEFCDVVSINYYLGYKEVSPEYLEGFTALSGRPLLITEFSYRAMENRSGNRNTRGADVTVATQADRAAGYSRYARSLSALPFVIGCHWFQYFDEPTGGRSFDGEDSDYGIVDLDGEPYEALTQAMREANAAAYGIHAASAGTRLGQPVFLDEPIKLNRGKTGDKKVRPLFGASPLTYGWADAANGAKAAPAVRDGSVWAEYDCGTDKGWGSGFTVLLGGERGEEPVDLSAFQGIELEISASAGLRLEVFLGEEGMDEAGKGEYRGLRGSDGESFSSGALALSEGLSTIRVPFDSLALRSSYGNQKGNRCVDLAAIKAIELYLPGGQGSGTIGLRRCVPY
jgi:hypothetical protein